MRFGGLGLVRGLLYAVGFGGWGEGLSAVWWLAWTMWRLAFFGGGLVGFLALRGFGFGWGACGWEMARRGLALWVWGAVCFLVWLGF
ncbi:hypothetical protein BKH40_08385 [Helicobacter sp. 11S02629-2]|nr:hypothetical protein BKH40_08385 [Helicobacter sp. 11S02629-2]